MPLTYPTQADEPLLDASRPSAAWQADTASTSPAQARIDAALKALRSRPDVAIYRDLAMAYAERARETGDPTYYTSAEQTVSRVLAASPADFEARKIRVWLMLGRHEFARARDEAMFLNRIAPDDAQIYGFLADAHAELGEYDAAETAVQRMLDLRGDVPALTRAAYLRELYGDIDGALEMLDRAYQRTPESETEDRAWILTQVAQLQLTAGDMVAADAAALEALESFPGYHYALGQLAKVRLAQGRATEAVTLLETRYRAAPHPENLFELAKALDCAGLKKRARAAFSEFERTARAEMNNTDNANRELVFYYIDHASRPAEALRIAELEVARRGDVYTRDAYAWALAANGRRDEARRELEAVLSIGVRDPELRRHASEVGAR